ncbi:hypothetical protein J7M28_12925, partial [bacterium]|nr:hypothetical protein [bacterium]
GEGIRLHGRGLSIDLDAQKVVFDSGITIISRSSLGRLADPNGAEASESVDGSGRDEQIYLTADRMEAYLKDKRALFSGAVSMGVDDKWLFAEQIELGWQGKLNEIEWGEARGVVVAQSGDSALGCQEAVYRDGKLVLRGDPLVVRGFDKLATTGREEGPPGSRSRRSWPLWPADWQRYIEPNVPNFLFGVREKFFIFGTSAAYLGCDTLSASKMDYEQHSGRFIAIGEVRLALGELMQRSQKTSEMEGGVVLSDELQFDVGAQEALFSGDVRLRAGQNQVNSEALTVKMRGDENEQLEIDALVFEGGVTASADVPTNNEDEKVEGAKQFQHVEMTSKRLMLDANGAAQLDDDVNISSEDKSLQCDTLQLTWDSKTMQILRLEAEDNIVLESEGRIATGGKLIYDGNRERAELTRQPRVWFGDNVMMGRKLTYDVASGNMSFVDAVRGVFYSQKGLSVGDKTKDDDKGEDGPESMFKLSDSLSQPGKVELRADALDYNEKSMIGTYYGDVTVQKDEALFSADEVKLNGDPTTGEIRSIEASGNVRIEDGDRVGIADSAIYYAAEQKIVLSGDPKVYEFGKAVMGGYKITLDLDKKQYFVDGESDRAIKTTFFIPKK